MTTLIPNWGIDILARIKHSAFKSRIAIIELKDDNVNGEPQRDTMYQALIYATFIAHLLRSKSGKYWWYIFKNRSSSKDKLQDISFEDSDYFKQIDHLLEEIPNHIDLDVVTLMPEGNSDEGELNELPIEDLNVTLHLYTLYFKTDKNGNPCGFSGTLANELESK